MNCREIKELLSPYLESEVSDSERLIIEAHLDTCGDCQREKALLEQTWSMLDGVQVPEVSSHFTANLMAKIFEQGREKPEFGLAFPEVNIQSVLRVLVPVAASGCVLIVVALFAQHQWAPKQQAAKVVLPEQKTVMQVQENVPVEPAVTVAEEKKAAPAEAVKSDAAKPPVTDEDIIRNLDVYTNMEMYQNYPAVKDLDVVQNLGPKGMQYE